MSSHATAHRRSSGLALALLAAGMLPPATSAQADPAFAARLRAEWPALDRLLKNQPDLLETIGARIATCAGQTGETIEKVRRSGDVGLRQALSEFCATQDIELPLRRLTSAWCSV